MMKRLKTLIIGTILALFVVAPVGVVALPTVTNAAFAYAPDCENRAFLGLPVWYRGLSTLDKAQNCTVVSPALVDGGMTGFIWKIALNVIEMGMILAGYVALFIILYSGFLYLTNGSNPSVVEKARVGIINATIGLAIALGSIGILNLVFRIFG